MSYPSKEQILRILEIIEEKEKRGEIVGARMLPKDATPVDRMKYRVCRNILVLKMKYNLTHQNIADLIGSDRHKVSKIVNYWIGSFTLDRLLNYYDVLIQSTENKKTIRAFDKEVEEFLGRDELMFG